MSQSLFEIRRVFQQNRLEIGKVNQDTSYSMSNVVRQYGKDQLIDNVAHMLGKEGGKGARNGVNLQYNPVDYMQSNFGGQIPPKVREEAVLSILQFAVQTQCQDQTVLQAVHLADNYLRLNSSCQPAFMRIIYAMALEISIKLNEQMVLSIEDIEKLFDNRFNSKMLLNLERHILSLNNFRVNIATPLDFVLNFVFLEEDILSHSGVDLQLAPEELINETIPLLHYALTQYSLSRKKYSSIAIAAICHVLQEVYEDLQTENSGNGPLSEEYEISPMQRRRDNFLDSVLQRFPQIDIEEISEILAELKEPFRLLVENGENEYDSPPVQEPWGFERLAINCILPRNSGIVHVQQKMQGLNLDHAGQQDSWRRGIQNETDDPMVFSTAETSVMGTGRAPNHLVTGSQSSMGALEESKSSGPGRITSRHGRLDRRHLPEECAPPELGRPSLSEQNDAKSKQFSPQFDRISSHTKRTKPLGDGENLLDDDDEPSCDAFMNSQNSGEVPQQPRAVDNVFSVAKRHADSQSDEEARDSEDEDEDDQTYNSKGKRLARKRPADKKQSAKGISRQPKKEVEGKAKKPAKHKLV